MEAAGRRREGIEEEREEGDRKCRGANGRRGVAHWPRQSGTESWCNLSNRTQSHVFDFRRQSSVHTLILLFSRSGGHHDDGGGPHVGWHRRKSAGRWQNPGRCEISHTAFRLDVASAGTLVSYLPVSPLGDRSTRINSPRRLTRHAHGNSRTRLIGFTSLLMESSFVCSLNCDV